MASYSLGINGPVIGKVGTVVGYIWKGRPCLRAYRRDIAYPNTPRQQSQRDWFVSMVRFASKAVPALKMGLRESAKRALMTEGNYFVRENKRFFHGTNGTVEIDYSSLKLSEGGASDVYFNTPRFEEGEILEVTFAKNSTLLRPSGDDSVYLFVYNPRLEDAFFSAPASRRNKQIRVRLPQQWAGDQVHIYGFVVNHEGKASRTTYIGTGRINHYEDGGRFVQINKEWLDFVDCARFSTEQSRVPSDSSSVESTPSLGLMNPPGTPPDVP